MNFLLEIPPMNFEMTCNPKPAEMDLRFATTKGPQFKLGHPHVYGLYVL